MAITHFQDAGLAEVKSVVDLPVLGLSETTLSMPAPWAASSGSSPSTRYSSRGTRTRSSATDRRAARRAYGQ